MMAEGQAAQPKFIFPQIHDNPLGWGPCEVPEQFKDTPYQPFSKDDRLGKVSLPYIGIMYNCSQYEIGLDVH